MSWSYYYLLLYPVLTKLLASPSLYLLRIRPPALLHTVCLEIFDPRLFFAFEHDRREGTLFCSLIL